MVKSARIFEVLFGRRLRRSHDGTTMGCCEASVHHAVIVIFLEYFSWGLLTVPVINVRFYLFIGSFLFFIFLCPFQYLSLCYRNKVEIHVGCNTGFFT